MLVLKVRTYMKNNRTQEAARNSEATRFNRSLDLALDVLSFFLPGERSWGISELARETGMYKSRIFRIVKTFEHHGLLEFDDQTGGYNLGPTFKIISSQEGRQAITRRVHAILEKICKETRGTVVLRKRVRWELQTIDAAVNDFGLQIAAKRGTRSPLVRGVHGKIFLAYDDPPLRDVLRHYHNQLPGFTQRTITDAEKLQKQLEQIRAKGYAFSDEESSLGVRAVGVPILGRHGKLIASLSIALPTVLCPRNRLPQFVSTAKLAAKKIGELLSGRPQSEGI